MAYPSYGLRDSESEPDGYVAFSWVHTFNPNLLLTISPFYHYNQASYNASPNDFPVITNVNQTSNYGGLQASLNAHVWKNDLQVGMYGFGQHQSEYFDNVFNPCVSPCENFGPSTAAMTGGVEEIFVSDKFKPTSWLTLIAGFRQSHFSADLVENAVDPRVGIAVQIPQLNWVFRGFYGRYYQAPPLLTATGPLLNLANSQNVTFAPLPGSAIKSTNLASRFPIAAGLWTRIHFQTTAQNWLDHSNIGESNLFWPLTWDNALIQTWELTLRSPRLWRFGQFHLAYCESNRAG